MYPLKSGSDITFSTKLPFSLLGSLLLTPFAPIAYYIEPEPLKKCVNE